MKLDRNTPFPADELARSIELIPIPVAVIKGDDELVFANTAAGEFDLDFYRGLGSHLACISGDRYSFQVLYAQNYVDQPVEVRIDAVRQAVAFEETACSVWLLSTARSEGNVDGLDPLHRENLNLRRLISVFSHEFRNPLAAALINADLLESSAHRKKADEAHLPRMREQLLAMQRMLDDLLDVERFEQGKYKLQKSRVNLLERVRRLILDTRRHVHLNIEGDEACHDEAFHIHADDVRIDQLLNNLLENAIKYSPEQTPIRVELTAAPKSVELKVVDQGRGMTSDELRRIQDAFYQGQQDVSRRYGGLGLGAYITRIIADLHGAQLRYYSEGRGCGSTVTVTFPLPEASTTNISPEESKRAASSPVTSMDKTDAVTVLVVDDNVDLLQLYSECFEMWPGYELSTAKSGQEGLQFLTSSEFDIALLDIGLPDIDGYRLAREFHRLRPDYKTQLIALTGYGSNNDVQRAHEAGFQLHLTKPITFAALQAAIAKVLA